MNKLKIIIRSILRHRLDSGIIIISLATGMACFNLIAMFISREMKTDNFHKNSDQIFALKCDDPWVSGGKMYYCKFGSAEYMKENLAQVKDFCRISAAGSQKIIVGNDEYFDKPQIINTSENFFDFFSYNLLTRNQESALEAESNIVISDELAKKYFGADDPLGRIISFTNRDQIYPMVVSGVFEKPQTNTQIEFDMVRLIGDTDSRCYLGLSENSNKEEVEKLFKEKSEVIPVIHGEAHGKYYLESLKDAYYNTGRASSFERSRDKTDLLIALVIGLMILGVAAFNYFGMLTNALLERSREFSIRKVNGGSKFIIILDLMVEYLIIIGISFLLSLLLMQEMIPFFNDLTGSHISERLFLQSGQMIILMGVVVFLLLVTLLFILFRLRAEVNSIVLKTGHNQHFNRINIPVFNILQLVSTIGLLICSIVIIRQMDFISEKPIGLNKEVIEIKLTGQNPDKTAIFKDELLQNAFVEKVAVVNTSPVLEHFMLLLKYEDNGVEKEYSPAGFSGDENFLTAMDIQVLEGSGFSENISANKDKCVINESFAKMFAGKDLIGKPVPGMEDKTVIGIVEDFNYSSLKSYVGPAFISFSTKGSHLMVKAKDGQYALARDAIKLIWQKLIPDYPVNIESIGERFEWFHRENRNYIRLIGSCSIISILLSMIGLFAISYQTSQYRTKEIGIRKINGAKIYEVLMMLNKDYIKWLAIAFAIATPLAWLAMNNWLRNFAYKSDMKWWIFGIAALLATSITLLAASWQSWRAATRNPIESLRYE